MCGKASVSHLTWSDIFAWAGALTPPAHLPPDPERRINISPSRLRRKSEPDSMIWESLPIVYADRDLDVPTEAVWPYLPYWSHGRLPYTRDGKLLSTANARLRRDGAPFAPTFMQAWDRDRRVVVFVSWFYEFDRRVHPQVPWAVFPLDRPFWAMAGLASFSRGEDGIPRPSVAIITVEPNDVLTSVGHHRSPALLADPGAVATWLRGDRDEALELLQPFANEVMGVEAMPMNIKIPGNEDVELPEALAGR
ncbi:MAG: SOS response-associated peptidase family protein [Xanthomonadales bacterium]|jgi:putative SOS response-associated peptidase YedK|nr:SOS response-associated peptidase family protein [Xanthomonadales bacterium]